MPKWALVTEQLLYKETKIREKETGGTESKAKMTKHLINKRGPKCFNFRKNGLMKHDCQLLRKDSKESLKKKLPKRESSLLIKCQRTLIIQKNEHIDGLFAYFALLINNERSSWSVDSGVTCHMCHDVNKFINFKKLDVVEDVILGDGHSVDALEIGTVELNVCPTGNNKDADCMKHYMFPNYPTIY